jgi:hypothetical protein
MMGMSVSDVLVIDIARLGACGINNSPSDMIVAIGHALFDTKPGSNGNAFCGRKISVSSDHSSTINDLLS